MTTQSIDRITSSTESLKYGPSRIKTALAERALRKQVAMQTRHIEELHEMPVSATVTSSLELQHALTAVREIALLTQADQEVVASTAEFALDDSAEHLFHDLKEAEAEAGNKISIGIVAVLDALEAWDIARSEATHDLAAVALNNFKGSAQENLVAAFRAANKSGSPFNDELDTINEQSS